MGQFDQLSEQCRNRLGRLFKAKWRLDELLDVGSIAAVYAATHRNGAKASIKVLHAHLSEEPLVRERFLRDAYFTTTVDHPALVRVLDDDVTEEGEPFLVMERLLGETLQDRAARLGGRLPLSEVVWVADRTLSLLERAHRLGVVHGELSPEKLFLAGQAELKVLDLGASRMSEPADAPQLLLEAGPLETNPFLAPEQRWPHWGPVQAQTDLWALGAIMLTLLTGQSPYEESLEKLRRKQREPGPTCSLSRLWPAAPEPLTRFMDCALDCVASRRFSDASAMRTELRRLISSGALSTEPQATLSPVSPPSTEPQPSSELQDQDLEATLISTDPVIELDTDRVSALGSQPDLELHAGRVLEFEPQPAVQLETEQSAVTRPPPSSSPRARTAPPPLRPSSLPPSSTRYSVQNGSRTPPASPSTLPGAVQLPPAPKLPAEPAATLLYDTAQLTEAHRDAMKELFGLIERAIVAHRQYGAQHTETQRRLSQAYSACASTLLQCDEALLWNVTPFSFAAKQVSLWEPEPPADQIPYQLFADGVRLLGLLPGLTESEFIRFLRVLMLDRATELSPEDDMVTMLWEAGLEHVVLQAIDTFVEADQQTRAQFARAQAQIMALAEFDTADQIESCWQGREDWSASMLAETKIRSLLGIVSPQEHADALGLEALARAALSLDEPSQSLLQARLLIDTQALGSRFAEAAVAAYQDGSQRGSPSQVALPLQQTVDALAGGPSPELALEFVKALCTAIPEEQPGSGAQRATLLAHIVSERALKAMLSLASRPESARHIDGLRLVLGYLSETHLTTVLPALATTPTPALRQVLLEYVQRTCRGHEPQLGALFSDADLDLALSLLRILSELQTPAARDALIRAAQSPYPVVRIEALGCVEGASSERLRLELRTLLQDREPEVRLAALRAIEKYRIRVAGPFLVMRIKSADFDALPLEERRQALSTVASLASSRAETICLEILRQARLLSNEDHELTRELAAELLGNLSHSGETLQALEDVASRRWKNSDPVRRAAASAAERVRSRTARPPSSSEGHSS